MRIAHLLLRSLVYRWRANCAAALGVALATAVLVGALAAGDSVRASLKALALNRLGRIEFALEAGDRFFMADLSQRLSARLGGRAVSAVVARGSASARGGEARASAVQVLGVDEAFWEFAEEPPAAMPAPNEVLLNRELARQLRVAPGDEVLLRVPAGSTMPAEAPLAGAAGGSEAIRVTVKAILSDRNLGKFGLKANQAQELNAFLSRSFMASRIGRPGRANLILLGHGRPHSASEIDRALDAVWKLEDAGLSVHDAGTRFELISDRVFIEAAAEQAALAAGGRGVLTYFIDRISAGSRSISYAFASSGDPFLDREQPRDDEILLNTWAARELAAGPGDSVVLEYQVPDSVQGTLMERRVQSLRVRGVVPILPSDRDLMPIFPGFAGVKNCRDWNPGVPLDLTRIGPRDQAYWDSFGGSPKAFVSMPTAQRLWGNRFGRLTAVRFGSSASEQKASIGSRLSPRSLGLAVTAVREVGLAASSHGVDFGSLFLGLSCFLVLAALMLTALLSLLSVERRVPDIALFSVLGFTRRRIRVLVATEGALVALAGSVIGIPLGLACLRGIMAGLTTIWRDAVHVSAIIPLVAPASLAAGAAAGLAAALAASLPATSMVLRSPAPRSLRGARHGRWPLWPAATVVGACAGGAALALSMLPSPTSFFASGALLLAASLVAIAFLLSRLGRPRTEGLPSAGSLGTANAVRRRTRSMTVASLLGCGVFIVIAVAANRPSLPDPARRDSGTGGFSLFVETSIALTADRERRLLPPSQFPDDQRVGVRVLEGDDASCLNLYRAMRPGLLGAASKNLAGRFTFTEFAGARPLGDPWEILDEDLGPDTIPAVADASVIAWGLGLQLGDSLTYIDEDGRPLRIRLMAGLANSIFQGSLIISESTLARHFPSTAGRRIFLLEAPAGLGGDLAQRLERSLTAYGASVQSTAARLAQFDSVEGAYLDVFSLLGWLGMFVGTLGLGVVVAHNVAESRRELAIMRALGLGQTLLVRMVLVEHLLPVGLGLLAGAVASALAVLPAASLQGSGLQPGVLLAPIGVILVSAFSVVTLAAARALRADLGPALRNE